jgi:dienelactone hydrolase
VLDPTFVVRADELSLTFSHPPGKRRLSFAKCAIPPQDWRLQTEQKLTELLGIRPIQPCDVVLLRETRVGDVRVLALRMRINESLSIPAYLLVPKQPVDTNMAVMAVHGHGTAEPCIGLGDDYHHQFALVLAQRGLMVLCPELRGFGCLQNLASGKAGFRLDYWNWGQSMAYSLVTDGFQHGHTLLGDTVMDLLRWEDWLALEHGVRHVHVAGISYGGDLALTYPVFSSRVERIFASGTLGSFEPIFARCYNAPAHCIPGILEWMDRADIAGLNAPRPIMLHYGALDMPSDENHSASYNETVAPSIAELRVIYAAFGAPDAIQLTVSQGKRHEMDNQALINFMLA